MVRKIAVLTSGGDAPGMNAAIRAVVRYGIFNGLEVYGVKRGYKGLIEAEIEQMSLSSVGDIIQRGGTILRSARCPEFQTEDGRQRALNVLKIFKIDGLVVIGGDGTFRGGRELSKLGFNVIGVPGTIDNDLAYTEFTIGFDTAINTVLDAVSKLRDTCSSHERISVVEVMGRNCGDIALYAGLTGGAEVILVPEIEQDIDNLCKKLVTTSNRGKKQSIVMVAEGAGAGAEIAKAIQEKTGMEARATILGHIQRGGSPSAQDRLLASRMSQKAVDLLLDGQTSKVVGIKNGHIISLGIDEALNMERKLRYDLYELANVLSF